MATVEECLPQGLRSLHRLTGLPVVFGGATLTAKSQRQLRITRLIGTLGDALNGLDVPAGRGLGGSVLRHGVTRRVDDYASAKKITHDYDDVVVRDEHLTSLFAIPVVVQGTVRAVLYGGVRDGLPVGDRAVGIAEVIADKLRRDIQAADESTSQPALDDLAAVIRDTCDGPLRERLQRIHRGLTGDEAGRAAIGRLAPRELDVLRLAGIGASNLEIAAELLLGVQTVKAYLRSAMRKLDVHNRTAAVHAARLSGLL